MQKFIGEAYLLNVESYEKEGQTYWKYEFLVGEQDGGSGFLRSGHVETYISENLLIKGGGSFMELICVSVIIKEFYIKGTGKVTKPVYEVMETK